MLNDLKQPAKDWIADAMGNLGGLLDSGSDPSFTLIVYGAEIEIRLNKLPGHFERVQIPDTCGGSCLHNPIDSAS